MKAGVQVRAFELILYITRSQMAVIRSMVFEWEPVCCVSGFRDTSKSGVVVSAHIHDRALCLAEGDKKGALSMWNRLWLRADLRNKYRFDGISLGAGSSN